MALGLFLVNFLYNTKHKPIPSGAKLNDKDLEILRRNVDFYNGLSTSRRKQFEQEVAAFLSTIRITGIGTKVEALDRILVGASATIPLFGFNEWHYPNLREVVLYSDRFNMRFETGESDSTILGMVGSGVYSGQMFLSQKHLRMGFSTTEDRRNVGIHEFTHLVDGFDGSIEGVPSVYLKQPSVLPWMDLIKQKSDEIMDSNSDIDRYALSNAQEFLAVTAEYFFESPKILKKNHPELYRHLNEVFNQDPAGMTLQKSKPPRRNDPCWCGSDKKYKNCHGH